MYGIFTYIYHKNQPNVGKLYHTWIVWAVLIFLTNIMYPSKWDASMCQMSRYTNHPARLLDWQFTIIPIPFPRRLMPSPAKPSRTKDQSGITPSTVPVCMLPATHFILGLTLSWIKYGAGNVWHKDQYHGKKSKTKQKMYHDKYCEGAPKNCHASKRDGTFQQTTT